LVTTRRKRSRSKKNEWTLERIFTSLMITIIVLVGIDSEFPTFSKILKVTIVIAVISYLFYRFGPYKINFFRNKYRNSSIKEVDCMDGLEFEHYLQPLFEAKGYNAIVTQGSGDYGADLVLSRKGKKTVVQAKCYSSNIGVDAIQQVVAAMPVYRASNAIVVTNRYYTNAAKKLAKVNRVRLVDRDELINMINHYQTGHSSIFNRLLAPFRLRLDRD
jgi:restriction system protein